MTAASPPAPPAELTLRICGTAQDGRLVRLRGTKCTIGTDHHCTLRLKASGVSPLHCLIIRGPERTIVRRWSVETRLNGRDFSEAILQIGDRLKVGAVEFEVVDGVGGDTHAPPAVSQRPPADPSPVVPPSRDAEVSRSDAIAKTRNARTRRLLNRVRELQQENELGALRLARLEEANRQLELAHRRLQQAHARSSEMCAAQETQVQIEPQPGIGDANLAAAQLQLQADRQAFDEQRASWRMERERLHDELARWNDALERRSAELDALSLDLASRQTGQELETLKGLRHQFPEGATQTDSHASDLTAEHRQLDAERQALADERDVLAVQRNTLAADHERLAEAQSALAQDQARLADEQAQLVNQQARMTESQTRMSDEQKSVSDEQARLTAEQAGLTAEQQRLKDDRDQLSAMRQQLDQERETFLRERQHWQEERSAQHALPYSETGSALDLTSDRRTEPFNTQLERKRQELDAREAELESQQQQLDRQSEELVKARAEQADELSKARAELADLRAQLDRARQANDRAPAEGASDGEKVRKLQSVIEAQQARLQSELREFEEHKNALQLERLDWQSETSRTEADMAARREEMDRRAAELEKMHSDQESSRRQLEEAQKGLERRQEALEQSERELQQRIGQGQQEQTPLDLQRKELEQARALAAAERESLGVDRTELASQREALETQKRGLEKELSLLAIDRQALTGERAALSTDRQALAAQKQELEKERAAPAADRQSTAGERTAMGGEGHAPETQRQQDHISKEDWARRLAELTRQLTEATERLNRARSELEQQQVALEATRREFDDQRQQWQTERQRMHFDHQNELETLREELRRRLAGKSLEQEARHADAQTLSSQGAADPAAGEDDNPVVQEVLTELRALGELSRKSTDTDSDVAAGESASVDQGAGYEEARHAAEPQLDEGGEETQQGSHDERRNDQDVSVDDYMTRLLRRLRGGKSGHEAPKEAESPSHSQTAGDETPGEAVDTANDEQAVQDLSTLPKPRTMAPELSSDLMAMRELANLSARTAIDKHKYRNWGRAAFGKLTIAVLAGGAGAGAIYFAESPHSLLMCAGLASLVVTLFWLLQAGILIKNVIMAARRNADFVRAAGGDEDDTSTTEPAHEEVEDDEYSPAEIIAVRDDDEPPVDDGDSDLEYQSQSEDDSLPVE